MDKTQTQTETGEAPSGFRLGDVGLGRLVLIVLQLGLVLVVMHLLNIEQNRGFLKLTPLIFGGFIVHALLPRRFRLPFFLFVSLAGFVVLLGFVQAAGLILIGLGLIGLCHLPIDFRWRVALVTLAGAVLVALRAEWITTGWSALPTLILPIIGAIFMFRLIIYMYDLQHERDPASLWERLSYFFILPNVCFLLFPVIDYQTFRRTYYDTPNADTIYQKGVLWMFRGVTHLLLYRYIYYYLMPSPTDIVDLAGVVQYMLATYLLYLRISGQFHLVIGMLCLFGFNLPETHHLYYLASSFNDYWRRINIYWKDFMMNIFYYPSFMRLRHFGIIPGLIGATAVVFLGTWLLHSYQWFWLLGSFPLTLPDLLFWGILGTLVAFNAVREVKKGRKVSLSKPVWNLKTAVIYSAKVVGMFVFITVLWTLWSGHSIGEFVALLDVAGRSEPIQFVVLAGVLAALIVLGVGIQWLNDRGINLSVTGSHPSFRRSAVFTTVGVAVLILVSLKPVQQALFTGETGEMVSALQEARFNQRDEELLERGYYESLLESANFTSALWQVQASRPPGWDQTIVEAGAGRLREDLLRYELRPSVETTFKQARLTTNEWGMRDQAYTQAKPPNTYRVAVLGASNEMGWGVEDGETMEAVAEARLNAEWAGRPYERYELLNFSVSGYSVIQNVMVAENRALDFDPDAVFYMAHANDASRLIDSFARAISEGWTIPYPFLIELAEDVGMRPGMEMPEAVRRLVPRANDVVRWAYQQIGETCRAAGVVPVWVFSPRSYDTAEDLGSVQARLRGYAEEAGFVLLSIDQAYADVADPRVIQLAPWDKHPNARAHRLLADQLVAQMQAHAEALRLTPQTEGF